MHTAFSSSTSTRSEPAPGRSQLHATSAHPPHHRLAIEAGGTPTVDRTLIKRWLALEQRLANLYAKTYVQIYDVIASSNTPTQRHQEVSRLETLIHAPDRLRALAAHLDEQLHIPDCTGGGE